MSTPPPGKDPNDEPYRGFQDPDTSAQSGEAKDEYRLLNEPISKPVSGSSSSTYTPTTQTTPSTSPPKVNQPMPAATSSFTAESNAPAKSGPATPARAGSPIRDEKGPSSKDANLEVNLVLEEYRHLRASVESTKKDLRTLEQFCIGGAAIAYVWLASSVNASQLPIAAWFVPLIFPLLGGFRTFAVLKQLDLVSGYILCLEDLVKPSDLSEFGWEKYYQEYGRPSALSNTKMFWGGFLALTSVLSLWSANWRAFLIVAVIFVAGIIYLWYYGLLSNAKQVLGLEKKRRGKEKPV